MTSSASGRADRSDAVSAAVPCCWVRLAGSWPSGRSAVVGQADVGGEQRGVGVAEAVQVVGQGGPAGWGVADLVRGDGGRRNGPAGEHGPGPGRVGGVGGELGGVEGGRVGV